MSVSRFTPEPASAARGATRTLTLLLLVAAPLALGTVHSGFHPPFLLLAGAAGGLSWAASRAGKARGRETPPVPGRRLLLALNLLVLLQLVPLPHGVLRAVSPYSLEYHQEAAHWAGLTLARFVPLSLSPERTAHGLLFLFALTLLYGTVFREFGGERRGRTLAVTIVAVAVALTLVGFLQKSSSEPGMIYGWWEPAQPQNVFGPYVNRNHYAGYVVMALPLALAIALGSLQETRRRWRYAGFATLGESSASRVALFSSISLFLAAGVLAAGSRAGVIAAIVSALVVSLARGRWAVVSAGVALAIAAAGLAFVDVGWFVERTSGDRMQADRVVVWLDMLKIVPRFPVFGVGWNAFGIAYRWRYQTVYQWGLWNQAHNEYLQALFEVGLVGIVPVLALLALLARGALRAARQGDVGIGVLGALVANATTNLVDFNLQIPANAAAFTAIAGLAMALAAKGDTEGEMGRLQQYEGRGR
jgi:O-antigen ligase